MLLGTSVELSPATRLDQTFVLTCVLYVRLSAEVFVGLNHTSKFNRAGTTALEKQDTGQLSKASVI